MDSKKIVIVQKDKIIKSILELFIENLNHEVYSSFFTLEECIAFTKQNKPDLVLIDLNIFENTIDKPNIIKQLKQLLCPVIFMGNTDEVEIGKEMINFNLYAFMSKPISKEILSINIDLAFAKLNKIKQNERSLYGEKCNSRCITNHKGEILRASNSFKEKFNVSEEKVLLSKIFQNNLEFARFDKSFNGLKEKEHKNSIFAHKSSIYNCRISKVSSNNFKLCFQNAQESDTLSFHKALKQIKFLPIYQSDEGALVFRANGSLEQANEKAKSIFRNLFDTELLDYMDIKEVLSVIPKTSPELLNNIFLPSSVILDRVVNTKGKKTTLNIEIKAVVSDIHKSIGSIFMNIRDISESQYLKEEIKKVTEILSPFLSNTIQRLFLVDLSKKIIIFNNAAAKNIEKKFNYTLKNNEDIRDFLIGNERRMLFEDAFEKAKKGENVSYKIKTELDTETIWDEVHYNPIADASGNINKILIWSLDITESEKTMAELTEKKQRYELIAQNNNDGLWDWDLETNELHVSEEWEKLTGYSSEDIIDKFGTLENIIHPDDRPKNKKAIKACLEDGSNVFRDEPRLLCSNKKYKWVLERGVILHKENGKPYRITGAITDITEQKEKDLITKKLNQSLLEERALFNKGKVGVLRIDAENRTSIKYISKSCVSLIGYTQQEFYNKSIMITDIIHPEDKERRLSESKNAIKNNLTEIFFSDYRLVKKNGDIIWVKDYANILRDENGNQTDILEYFIDITHTKNTENEYQYLQSIFSCLWKKIQEEAAVIDYNGKILYSNNNKNLPMKKIVEKDIYIFDYFKGIPNWDKILSEVRNNNNISYIINQDSKILDVKINAIDDKKLLVLGSRIDS